MKKVFAITVTYGNRFHFTSKLVNRLLELNVHKIIIVDNGSDHESRQLLSSMVLDNADRMVLIALDTNLGSAGGFKKGLMFAHGQPECELIWLLDDDNFPHENAFSQLLNSYELLGGDCCLFSLRKDRVPYRKVYNATDVRRKFRPHNAFVNFNIFHGIVRKFLFNVRREKLELVPIPYGPYGGMFFSKKMLDVVGYPNEKMFLYLDDHDFSYRMIRAGFSLYLDRRSVVDDLEKSWHGIKKYRMFKKFMLLIDGEEMKSYYTIRNLIYFERKYYVNNSVVYAINRFLFTSIYNMLCYLLNKRDRIAMLERAYLNSEHLN